MSRRLLGCDRRPRKWRSTCSRRWRSTLLGLVVMVDVVLAGAPTEEGARQSWLEALVAEMHLSTIV